MLLIEVSSNKELKDERRMLLQAACLVRLGNTLFKTSTLSFLVKAIYIDPAYQAKEYTVYAISTNDDHRQMVLLRFGLLPRMRSH